MLKERIAYISGSDISEYKVLEKDLQNHDRFLLSKSSPGGFVAEEDGELCTYGASLGNKIIIRN